MSNRQFTILDEDRQLADFIPPVSILLAGIIFLVGTILAIITYETPNGKYQFLDQFFSELGVRKTYVETFSDGSTELRYAPPYPDIFNFTLMLTGVLLIPFFSFSFRQMRNASMNSTRLLWVAIVTGILCGPMLFGAGFFDLSFDSQAVWQEHGFWVAFLYIFITVASIAWFFMLMLAKDLPYKTSKLIWLDYILLFILAVLALINLADGMSLVKVVNIPVVNTLPVEAYQKFIAYIFFIYFGLIVGGRLTLTKYDNTPVVHSPDVGHTHRPGSSKWYCTNCGQENEEDTEICSKCQQSLT